MFLFRLEIGDLIIFFFLICFISWRAFNTNRQNVSLMWWRFLIGFMIIVFLSDYISICSFVSNVESDKLIQIVFASIDTFLKMVFSIQTSFWYQYFCRSIYFLSFFFFSYIYSRFGFIYFFSLFLFRYKVVGLVWCIDSVCVNSVLKLNQCDKIDAVEIDMKPDLFQDWLWRIADGNRAGPYNLRPILL